MLYKTAAYVVVFTITLLFTTSEAEINMKSAKDTVRMLLTKFIGTALDHKAKDLHGLIYTATTLINQGMFIFYLTDIVQNGNCSRIISKEISVYKKNFLELLDERETSHQTNRKIPMFEVLTRLQKRCAYYPERTSQTEHATSSEAFTSLGELLRAESKYANEVDESGFKIQKAKLEVKVILDVFLQLVFDIKCNDVLSLKGVADFLLENSGIYYVLSEAVSDNKWTIMRDINTYVRDIWRILNEGGVYKVELIPMKKDLRSIQLKCVECFGGTFKTSDNPVRDIVRNNNIDITQGKDTVIRLLSRFISTVVDHQSKDFNGLKSIANLILSDDKIKSYLAEITQDTKECRSMSEEINIYENNFRELLNEVRITHQEEQEIVEWEQEIVEWDKSIPMMEALAKLRSTCVSQPESTSQTSQPESTSQTVHTSARRNKAFTSLRELLRTESEETSELVTDERGFKIQKGKLEVKIMLDVLLQLVLDKKCFDIRSLVYVANSLLDETPLYSAIENEVYEHKKTIMRDIDMYVTNFWKILNNVYVVDVELIPMTEMIEVIRLKCEENFGDMEIPPDPLNHIKRYFA